MMLRTNQFGAWSGAVYLVLVGLGAGIVAGFFPPHKPNAGASDIGAIFTNDVIRIRLGMLIAMVGVMYFILFAATLASYVARLEGRVGMLTITTAMSGLAAAMFVFFPLLAWIVLSFRTRPAELTQLVNDGAWMTLLGGGTISGPFFMMPIVMAFTDKSIHPVFPRWVGWYTMWVLLGSIGSQLLFFFKVGVFAWNGLLGFYIPIPLYAGLIGILVYYMARAARRPLDTAEPKAGTPQSFSEMPAGPVNRGSEDLQAKHAER